MYTFKARCISNSQSTDGSHVATLQGADGSQTTVPSKDLMFEVGSEYSFSIDGKFAPTKAAAKPVAPVVPAKPAVAPVPAPKSAAPTMKPAEPAPAKPSK
jgi:hypothetical protein